MTTMRTLTLIFFLTLFSLVTVGQKRITTIELENVADKYGIDSALKTVIPFTEIFQIDTAVALSIGLKCYDLKNYSRQFTFFTTTGQVIKSQAINSKAINNVKTYENLLSDATKRQFNGIVIPDQIFHVLVFQNDNSIIPLLKTEFIFWERKADSIRNTYPSKIKRFFQKFKGTPPSEQLFSDCKENCYKIAWSLNKFGARNFTIERANAIRQQLVPYLRNYDIERSKFKPNTFGSDTIQLAQSYNSITEIDFDNEVEFVKLKENLEGDKCYKQIITNNKMALYDIGCRWSSRAGSGKTLKLELVSSNILKVTVIRLWLS
jgi:hypothetical protein